MSVVTVLLLALGIGIGIAVAVKSKKLSITTLLVCGSFGLLLGTTAVGSSIRRFIIVTTESIFR